VACGFRQIIVNLASDGVFESGALQLSNAPSLKQIAQDFLIFWGSFQRIVPNGRIYSSLARNLLTRLKVMNMKVWTHFIKIVNMFTIS